MPLSPRTPEALVDEKDAVNAGEGRAVKSHSKATGEKSNSSPTSTNSSPTPSKSRKRLPSSTEAAREREQETNAEKETATSQSPGSSTPSTSVSSTPVVSPRDSFSKAHTPGKDKDAKPDTLDDIPLEQAEELFTLIRRPSQQRKVFRNFDRNYSKKPQLSEDGEVLLSPSSSQSALSPSSLQNSEKRPQSNARSRDRMSSQSVQLDAADVTLDSSCSARADSSKSPVRSPSDSAMPVNFTNLFQRLDEVVATHGDSIDSLFDASSLGLACEGLNNMKRKGTFARSYTEAEDACVVCSLLHSSPSLPSC